ncbi:hypothetical protein [Bradyrhizobium tunisiense]|uniref:hypothetical protein n=1 Tax=Bradyrhizobium tunisiense TaxID=3278709 RepID=UPI0035D5418A
MSALAFVCKAGCVEVLTDTLSFDVETGRVSGLDGKQIRIGSAAVIASVGWALPGDLFSKFAEETCSTFDELVHLGPELWQVVGDAVRAEYPAERYRYDPYVYIAAIAGWSHERGRAEAYMFDSVTGASVGKAVTAFALGGGDESMDDVLGFIRRFHPAPDEFNAAQHGVPLFESMRHSSSLVADHRRCTVGGSIERSVSVAERRRHDVAEVMGPGLLGTPGPLCYQPAASLRQRTTQAWINDPGLGSLGLRI